MVCRSLLFSFCIASANAVESDQASLLQHQYSRLSTHGSTPEEQVEVQETDKTHHSNDSNLNLFAPNSNKYYSQDDEFGVYTSSDGKGYYCDDTLKAQAIPKKYGRKASLERCKNFCRRYDEDCHWLTFFEDGSGCRVHRTCDNMVPSDDISPSRSIILFRDKTFSTPVLGDLKICSLSGDDHIFPFDMPQRGQDGYAVNIDSSTFSSLMPNNGRVWLVKAHDVSIQGLFGDGSLTSIAISGKMFDGKKKDSGKRSDDNGKTLIIEPGNISYRNGAELVIKTLKDGRKQYSDEYLYIRQLDSDTMPKLEITFRKGHYTSSLRLDVVRGGSQIYTEISLMRRTDVSGFCGNMDGNLDDEADNMKSILVAKDGAGK